MKRICATFVLFFLAGACLGGTGDVVLIGHFSNQKVTHDADPHFLSGYGVSLYQSDDSFFGDIGVATGSPEPASGRLYDITYDPKTKKLEFKAKYSGGRRYNKLTGPGGRESRVLLIFSGTITGKALIGTMVVKDGYSPNDLGESIRVVMKRTKEGYKPASMAKWNQLPYPLVDW
jgi:hypothetical protein